MNKDVARTNKTHVQHDLARRKLHWASLTMGTQGWQRSRPRPSAPGATLLLLLAPSEQSPPAQGQAHCRSCTDKRLTSISSTRKTCGISWCP